MKTYNIFKLVKETKNDKKAYLLLERLISGGYESEEERARIIIDKDGNCHQCDNKLATITNIKKYGWVAMYAISINDDKIRLQKLF
jgi:hypothetical protein